MMDGPFGSASEDSLNFETALLIGAGVGVVVRHLIRKCFCVESVDLHSIFIALFQIQKGF